MGTDTVRSNRDYNEFDRLAATLPTSDAKSREAEIFFKDFKREYPEETMVHWNLALIYEQTNRIEQAKKELREMLHKEPKNKEARAYLQQLEQL